THHNAIPLAPDVLREKSPVWVLSLPATGSCRWLKAQVVEASENLVFVQVQERFDGDKLVGTIVVNPAGELVMLSMGGDFLLTGASSVGISKKLQQSILTR
ncbi:MAG TPA: hypothetical protein PKD72_16740, partial [Gemmatales bacterium]|nr:hypothetical protein [Gemmatales bacterium]